MWKNLWLISLLIFLFMIPSVQAEKLFQVDAVVGGNSVSASYSKLEDLLEVVDNDSLQNLAANYTAISATSLSLNIRGLLANAQYAANSTTLAFSIPALNVNETFTGATRDESQELFEAYIKKNGNDVLSKMLSYMAGKTAVDPVAGNPNSLMSQMGTADFTFGTDFGGGTAIASSQPKSSQNSFGLGLRFGNYSAKNYDQRTYTLPVKYTYRFESNPRKQILFDLPIVYSDVEGSKSYSTSLGVGLRLPVTSGWSLTPAIRVGAVGSIDMGSAAVVYSGSLTSNYNVYWDDFVFTLGNMISYYKTQSIDVDDYSIDYDLQNTMTKNGIGVEGPMNMMILGKPTSWQFDVTHTAFFGDELYIESYFDFGLSFGTRANESSWDNLRFGVTYTYCDDYDGFAINFGYTF